MIDKPRLNSVDPDQTMNGSTEMYFFGVKINMIDRPCVNSVDPDQTMNGSTEMYFLGMKINMQCCAYVKISGGHQCPPT